MYSTTLTLHAKMQMLSCYLTCAYTSYYFKHPKLIKENGMHSDRTLLTCF